MRHINTVGLSSFESRENSGFLQPAWQNGLLHGQPSLQPCEYLRTVEYQRRLSSTGLGLESSLCQLRQPPGNVCVRVLFVCSSAWLRGSDSIVLVGRIGSMSAAARQLQAATRLSGCPGILQQLEDFLKLRKASSRRSKGLAASISDSHMPRCTCCGSSRCLLMIAFTL